MIIIRITTVIIAIGWVVPTAAPNRYTEVKIYIGIARSIAVGYGSWSSLNYIDVSDFVRGITGWNRLHLCGYATRHRPGPICAI